MTESNNHINYSAADIERYHRGEMPAAAMYAMEKAALEDSFLADAMDGYAASNKHNTIPQQSRLADITDLKQRLAARINQKEETPVVWFSWWKAAAVVFLFSGAAWIYTALNKKATIQSIVKTDEIKSRQPEMVSTDTVLNIVPGTVADSPKYPGLPKQTNKLRRRQSASAAAQNNKPGIDSSAIAGATAGAVPDSEQEADKNTIAKKENKDLADESAKKEMIKAAAPAQARRAKEPATANVNNIAKTGTGSASTADKIFTGTVTDQANKPVAAATVQIPDRHITTSTDYQGRFSFKSADTALRASVASVGFETQDLELTNNSIANTNNIIRLKPSLINLNEVVVTGYGTKKKKEVLQAVAVPEPGAFPAAGWNEYNHYLEKNKRPNDAVTAVHGEVVVSFTVTTNNRLRNFTIEKSLNEQADAEAIRLIKEGPSWKLLKGKKAKASVIVKF